MKVKELIQLLESVNPESTIQVAVRTESNEFGYIEERWYNHEVEKDEITVKEDHVLIDFT